MPAPDYLSLAQSMVGTREGQAALNDYLTTGGQNLDPVTTAWCAAFVNSTLEQSGMGGTGSNMARSFLDYGSPVEAANLQPGDIGIWPRGGNPALGHVGFVQSYDPKTGMVQLVSGNQSNAVTSVPYNAATAVGFRRPGESKGTQVAGLSQPPPGTAPTATPATTPAAETAKKPWWQRMARGLGEAAGGAGGGGIRPFEYNAPPSPGAAIVSEAAMPSIDPNQGEMQRQQLAQVMARLNSGRLFG